MYAVYVQPETIGTKANTDVTLSKVRELGFDTAVMCISGSPVYYRSALMPVSGRVTSTFDPLAYAIAKCRELSISPHIWWCPGLIPKDSAFRSRYPGLSCQDVVSVVQHWLFFGSTVAQKLCADVCAEIAAYHPDAIMLDSIRYDGSIAWQEVYTRRPQFQPEHVTATVQACRAAMPSSAGVKLTAAVFPGITNATRDHLQPWPDWIRDQLIDHALTMAYTLKLSQFGAWIAEWNQLANHDRVVPCLSLFTNGGPSAGMRLPADVTAQVNTARNAGYLSFCMFDNRGLGQSAGLDTAIQSLTKNEGGTVMSAIQDLRNEAAGLTTEANALDVKATDIKAAAQLLRDRAARVNAIADSLATADALADKVAADAGTLAGKL